MVVPVNILMGVANSLLGLHKTLPYILIAMTRNTKAIFKWNAHKINYS